MTDRVLMFAAYVVIAVAVVYGLTGDYMDRIWPATWLLGVGFGTLLVLGVRRTRRG
jgi:hypothetical protein